LLNGAGNRLLSGGSRGAGEFDEFINVVFHAIGKAKVGSRVMIQMSFRYP
jgi:hypothetical protein